MKPKSKKDSVKGGKKSKLLSTQRYLEFTAIHDNTLVLKNGGIRAIIEISAVNFNLKSEEEQNAIIYSYQNFLNALDFPVQILIQSRKLDIDQYVLSLKSRYKEIQNPLLRNQMGEYTEYIQKLVEYADIMEKNFYVIVPTNPDRSEKKGVIKSFMEKINPDDPITEVIQRKKEFKTLKKELDDRINVVNTGLTNIGLETKVLNTESIIELFYQAYNPFSSRNQKMPQAEAIENDGNPEDHLIYESQTEIKS